MWLKIKEANIIDPPDQIIDCLMCDLASYLPLHTYVLPAVIENPSVPEHRDAVLRATAIAAMPD
jgi:predicted butyrate kinase (DUF1464 family)